MKKCYFVLLPLIIIAVTLISIYRPQALRSIGSTAVEKSPEAPIILVHGFNQSSSFWDHIHLIKALKDKNYQLVGEYSASDQYDALLSNSTSLKEGQSACYKINLPEKGTKDIRDSAVLLEKVIVEVTAKHQCSAVKLVSFSAGGVVCRDYLTRHLNDHKVESLITISSPHLGSEHAWLAEGYHNVHSLISAKEADHSGNALVRNSRKYSVKGIRKVTQQLEKWSAKHGIDINSKCARMLARPEGGNYLAQLSAAPHPNGIHYHCIITEENLLSYEFTQLKNDFSKIKNGKLTQTDLMTTILDLGRFGLSHLDKISEHYSSVRFRGDGVVSQFSQNLNNLISFKNDTRLTAETTHLKTQHGGPETCNAIIRAINFK